MSRRFGKIVGTLWGSHKFNALPTETAKLAYVYLHTAPHGNSVGVYRLPAAYVAADLRISDENAGAALDALAHVGLIARDPLEDVVLIEDWWAHNAITNRKHLQAAIAATMDLPRRCLFRPRAAFEVSVAMIEKAQVWATDAKGATAAADALAMCRKMVLSALRDATDSALQHIGKALPIELSIELSEALSIERSSFPFPDRERDGEGDSDADKRQETETGVSAADLARDFVANARAAK